MAAALYPQLFGDSGTQLTASCSSFILSAPRNSASGETMPQKWTVHSVNYCSLLFSKHSISSGNAVWCVAASRLYQLAEVFPVIIFYGGLLIFGCIASSSSLKFGNFHINEFLCWRYNINIIIKPEFSYCLIMVLFYSAAIYLHHYLSASVRPPWCTAVRPNIIHCSSLNSDIRALGKVDTEREYGNQSHLNIYLLHRDSVTRHRTLGTRNVYSQSDGADI